MSIYRALPDTTLAEMNLPKGLISLHVIDWHIWDRAMFLKGHWEACLNELPRYLLTPICEWEEQKRGRLSALGMEGVNNFLSILGAGARELSSEYMVPARKLLEQWYSPLWHAYRDAMGTTDVPVGTVKAGCMHQGALQMATLIVAPFLPQSRGRDPWSGDPVAFLRKTFESFQALGTYDPEVVAAQLRTEITTVAMLLRRAGLAPGATAQATPEAMAKMCFRAASARLDSFQMEDRMTLCKRLAAEFREQANEATGQESEHGLDASVPSSSSQAMVAVLNPNCNAQVPSTVAERLGPITINMNLVAAQPQSNQASAALRPTADQDAAAKGGKAAPARRELTSDEANFKVRKFIRAYYDEHGQRPKIAEVAEGIGCSTGLVSGTHAWQCVMEEEKKRRELKPSTVNLGEKAEQVIDDRDSRLQKLVDAHKADFEPSPLEDDPPAGEGGRGGKVYR